MIRRKKQKKTANIAEMMESGEYYREAMNWYNSLYIMPKTDLAYMSVFGLIALTFFIVIFLTMISYFPLSKEYKHVMMRKYSPENSVSIIELDRVQYGASGAYAQFILGEYVKAREEYIEKRYNRNFNFVTYQSDDKIYEEFLQQTDISNPNNPLLLYGKQAEIIIKVDKIILHEFEDDRKPVAQVIPNKKATIYFKKILLLLDESEEISNYQADITFQYNQIIVDQKTHNVIQKPKIKITGYKTRSI